MKNLLSIASYGVLIIGFLYISFSMGRHYGNSERGDRVYMNCSVIEGPEEMECEMWELNTPELIEVYDRYTEVYEQVLREINNPTVPETWEEKYTEWEQRKLGL